MKAFFSTIVWKRPWPNLLDVSMNLRLIFSICLFLCEASKDWRREIIYKWEASKDWRREIIWAVTCDFQQCGIMTSVDSDEPVQPPFKLWISKCCKVSSLTVIEYSSDKQRLWPDCAYAQAGLSLCWSHIPHCLKSHVMAHIICKCTFLLSSFNPRLLYPNLHNTGQCLSRNNIHLITNSNSWNTRSDARTKVVKFQPVRYYIKGILVCCSLQQFKMTSKLQ